MNIASFPFSYRVSLFIISIIAGLASKSYSFNVFFSTVVFLLIVYESEWLSSVHMMFNVAFATFMYSPAILAGGHLDIEFTLFYLTALCSFVFLVATKGLRCHFNGSDLYYVTYFLIFGLLIIVLSFVGYNYVFALWGVFVLLFALNLGSKSFFRNFFFLSFFIFVFALYAEYGWNSFGRSVIMGFLITGVLYFLYAQEIKVPKLVWALLPAFGSTLLSNRSLTQLEVIGVDEVLRDSAFGPYILASTFIEYHNTEGYDFFGFWDNLVFTAFSFVLREWWPSKPFGFGFEFVVRHMDYYLADAGHSIASTMIGDHLYFLGYLGVLTSILMTLFVAWLCRYLYSLERFHGFGVAIIACYMLVFVWGGMTSLSARLIFPFATLIGLIFLERIRLFFANRKAS